MQINDRNRISSQHPEVKATLLLNPFRRAMALMIAAAVPDPEQGGAPIDVQKIYERLLPLWTKEQIARAIEDVVFMGLVEPVVIAGSMHLKPAPEHEYIRDPRPFA